MAGAGAFALAPISACGGTGGGSGGLDGGVDATLDTALDTALDTGLDTGLATDAALDAAADAAVDVAADASTLRWAEGGTAAMSGKADYPDPFEGAPTDCVLVERTTAGPCTTESPAEREDVSEGWTGLPLRLALRVVDGDCAPLVGVSVNIWHTNVEGSYSGETPSNGFCLLTQSYNTQNFFRGVQTTDARGVVYFDTCYPGWYPGRAIHIHFQVHEGAQSFRVSQLFFPEALTEEVFSEHPAYQPFGQPDTVFSNDGVIRPISSADRARLLMDVERMPDGTMLASKVVTVA